MLLRMSIVFVFATLSIVFYVVSNTILGSRQRIDMRLRALSKETSNHGIEELNQTLFFRIFKPFLDSITKSVLKATPKEMVASFEKRIIMAGNPKGLAVKDWVNLQVVMILCFPIITMALGYYAKIANKSIFFMMLLEICLGFTLPRLILSKIISARQSKIINSLPDVIDLLTVSVEAGLGFDGALSKVIERMQGPLSKEFENVLQEMKMGKQKKDALKDMAERLSINDLATFIGSVVQADQFGVPIGSVLRIQSEQMRQKRRQRAQEKAMKAPVKMIVPMVLFIFPTIFSVLLGPIVIKVMNIFVK